MYRAWACIGTMGFHPKSFLDTYWTHQGSVQKHKLVREPECGLQMWRGHRDVPGRWWHSGPRQKTFFRRKGKQSLCVKATQPANLDGKSLTSLRRKDAKKEALPGLTSTPLLKWLVVSGLPWAGVKRQQLRVLCWAVVKLFSGFFASCNPQALPDGLRWLCSLLARSAELPGGWVWLFGWCNLQLNQEGVLLYAWISRLQSSGSSNTGWY